MKQTAGHDALGEFAPEFAHLNDDILFGEVWDRESCFISAAQYCNGQCLDRQRYYWQLTEISSGNR